MQSILLWNCLLICLNALNPNPFKFLSISLFSYMDVFGYSHDKSPLDYGIKHPLTTMSISSMRNGTLPWDSLNIYASLLSLRSTKNE